MAPQLIPKLLSSGQIHIEKMKKFFSTAYSEGAFNIATLALGRREASLGAEALAIVQIDEPVSEGVLPLLRAIPDVLEARLVRLPTGAATTRSSAD